MGYGLPALAVLLGVIVARQQIAAGPAPGTATGELDTQPHDVAYLNGGPSWLCCRR